MMKLLRFLTLLFMLYPIHGFIVPTKIAPRKALARIVVPEGMGSGRYFRVSKINDAVGVGPSKDTGPVSYIIRVANHAPAFLSLLYFGLISMSSMMPNVMPVQPTITSVLTKNVGPTTNRLFADYFPTLVTPPSFIFLVWPTIVAVQVLTLLYSALQPIKKPATLSQDNLTALSLANLAATWWLIVASRTAPGCLTLGSSLILPLVPIFSGYPLRTMESRSSAAALRPKTAIFQLYSSFTTIASILALTVELQHGGRVPKLSAEAAASVFLVLYYLLLSRKTPKSGIQRMVQAGAISGIAFHRIRQEYSLVKGAATLASFVSSKSLLSVSFLGTIFVAVKAIRKLFDQLSLKTAILHVISRYLKSKFDVWDLIQRKLGLKKGDS